MNCRKCQLEILTGEYSDHDCSKFPMMSMELRGILAVNPKPYGDMMHTEFPRDKWEEFMKQQREEQQVRITKEMLAIARSILKRLQGEMEEREKDHTHSRGER